MQRHDCGLIPGGRQDKRERPLAEHLPGAVLFFAVVSDCNENAETYKDALSFGFRLDHSGRRVDIG
jgi:hypothetical protein